MILNIFVIIFILAMAFWWGSQGLFSALIHLVLTIVAGALAFGIWESVTTGFLLNTMPEYAWGVGLIAPFVLILIVLRVLADILVPGNVKFPQLANMIGGGVLGVISGSLTAGLVVIGFLYMAPIGVGYQPYQQQAGQITENESMWLSVDRFAAATFTTINDQALSPILAEQTFSDRHPYLMRSAGMHRIVSRPHARTTIRPSEVEVTEMFELPAAELPDDVNLPAGSGPVLAVTTDIQLKGEGGGAADSKGTFTATAAQAPLLYTNRDGVVELALPFGFVVLNTFGDLSVEPYARSEAAVPQQEISWLYRLPEGAEARAMRLKNVQLELPETDQPASEVEQWVAAIDWAPEPETEDEDADDEQRDETEVEDRDGRSPVEGLTIEVEDRIGGKIVKNKFVTEGGEVNSDNQIVRADGVYELARSSGQRTAIDTIAHPETTRIVQVKLSESRASSMYGRAMDAAAALTTPTLVREDGQEYQALGWIKYPSRGKIEMKIDMWQPMRGLPPEIAQMADDDEATLIFEVTKDARLTEFRIGGATQEINIVAD